MLRARAATCAAAAVCWLCWPQPASADQRAAKALQTRPQPGLHGVEPPHRSIYSLLEDRDGFLWIGTLDGLGRYDGYEMLVFRHDPDGPRSIPNNAVHVLLEDRRGVLWVGTENGLSILDRRSFEFERRPIPDFEREGGLIITCAFEDRSGRLWFGSNRGLAVKRPGSDRFEVFTSDPDDPTRLDHPAIIGIDEDQSGSIWIATSSLTATTLHAFVESTSSFERVTIAGSRGTHLVFLIDRADRAWLHPTGPVDLRSGRVQARQPVAFEHCKTTRAIVEDPGRAIWFGCDDGLYRVDPVAETQQRKLLAEGGGGYLENYIRALGTSRSGTLWVGTQAGLFRLDPNAKPFEHLGHDPEQADSLSAGAVSAVVEAPDGGFWVGSYGGGLDLLDSSLRRVRTVGAGSSVDGPAVGKVIWDLHLDGAGVLWIAGSGLWSLDTSTGGVELHLGEGDPPELAYSRIVESPAGILWLAGHDRRLYRYTIAAKRLETFAVSGEPRREWVDPRLDSLLVGGDGLWLASGDWLARLDPASGELLERVELETTDGLYLGSQGTWDLHEGADGSLWLGTSNGLLAYRPDQSDFKLWTSHDGLPGSVVYSILEDGGGRLWLGTNQGLASFDPEARDGSAFRIYTTADGTGNVEFNRHAAITAGDGRMLFGGMDGLTVFDPTRIHDNPFMPPIRITGIDVWSRDGARSINPFGLDRLELDHLDSTFGFRFAALSFTNPARNRYAYRLHGHDERWIDSGDRRSCQYTNIAPGSYVFQVRGSNNDGLWNELGVSLPVTVRPAFWQTWWFRTLVVATVTAIVGLALSYRRAKRREMQRLRLRIADDLHDDLSSDLSGIAVVTDMVQRKEAIQPDDRRDLIAVRDAAFKMVDGVRDIVWYIDPEHDNLDSAVIRMRSVATTLLRDLNSSFDVDLRDGARTLSMPVRRNLLMVFKEALHNAVRHAAAESIAIDLRTDGDVLRLRVADDGAGFDTTAELDNGHGLQSMRRRADEIGARLVIDSQPGRGTTVELLLDLANSRDGGRAVEGTTFKNRTPGA